MTFRGASSQTIEKSSYHEDGYIIVNPKYQLNIDLVIGTLNDK